MMKRSLFTKGKTVLAAALISGAVLGAVSITEPAEAGPVATSIGVTAGTEFNCIWTHPALCALRVPLILNPCWYAVPRHDLFGPPCFSG